MDNFTNSIISLIVILQFEWCFVTVSDRQYLLIALVFRIAQLQSDNCSIKETNIWFDLDEMT